MIFMRILPGVLKELVKHVPTVLFQTVEWSELASEFPRLSKRMMTSEGYDALVAAHERYLCSVKVKLVKTKLEKSRTSLSPPAGTIMLEIYFAQLFSSHGLFLDMRSQHFSWSQEELHWKPGALWVDFDPSFRKGMIKVYDGFYEEDKELFRQGLSEIGLLSLKWPMHDQEKLCQLFESQFRSADTEEVTFTLDHLRNSLIEMSQFLLSKKVSIHKDFLYLGVNLVTLYSSLEETKASFPVKDIYLEARKKFGSA